MEKFSTLVDVDAQTMERAHDDLQAATPEMIREVLSDAFDAVSVSVAHRLDDVDIQTIDRVDSGKNNHVAEKEIVSGDAVIWAVTTTDGGVEELDEFNAQYGIYAGRKGDEFVYNPVEVEIIPK